MDKRIVKTKKKLTSTLLNLIENEQIKDITVLELCKVANVNRTTFYKYYKDIDDFVYTLEESLISDLKNNIINIKRNYLITYIGKTIESIKEHKEIYSKLLSPNGDKRFLRKILYIVHDESINEWKQLLKKASSDDLENIYKFIVDGSTGIIENWINNNLQGDTQNTTNFINKLCMSGLSSFI
jgi:AcrR family transcriptional regulator